ncbi:MAG: twin-arginine translocase TatA/TatE family subunit [Phycisphaerae bacterium]|jgi:sec-independent protein translocase protein TatA
MAAEMIATQTGFLAFLESIGWPEWLLIAIVILLLFGGKKLPELARGLARGLRAFKEEMEGIKKDIEEPSKDKDKSSDAAKTDQKKDDKNP